MNALVTGATGFIGSHLVEELVRRGEQVTCLVRKTSDLKWIESLPVALCHGDCTDRDSLQQIPEDIDYIFHVAGITKASKAEDYYRVNAQGTGELLGVAEKKFSRLKRFVYLSSLAAAGPCRNTLSLNEKMHPEPVSDYGKSKLDGEVLAAKYRERFPVTILRPPAIYGPRDRDFLLFFQMIKKGFYPDWGKCYYSLLYVDDLVSGILRAAESDAAVGEIYFLSDGSVYSNEEIAAGISHVLGKRAVKIRLPLRLMAVLAGLSEKLGGKASIINRDKLKELGFERWVCDSHRAKEDFRFAPEVSFQEGMRRTADWYRRQKWL